MKVLCLSGDGGELVGEIYCNEVIDDQNRRERISTNQTMHAYNKHF